MCGGSPLFQLNTRYGHFIVVVFMSGRFTGRRMEINTLVLPSLNRCCFLLVTDLFKMSGRFTGKRRCSTLVLPSLNRSYLMLFFSLVQDVGEIHSGGIFLTLVLPPMNRFRGVLMAPILTPFFDTFSGPHF